MRLVLDDMGSVLNHLKPEDVEVAHTTRDRLLRSMGSRLQHTFGGSKPHIGELSPGCQLCGEGCWSCLFINGVCNATCFFCPGDMVHRDAPPNAERISFLSPRDYVAYVDRLGFRGVSLSGGEPFLTLDRSLAYASALREAKDDLFIWAYTNGKTATKEKLQALVAAGLDELRFNISARDYDLNSVADAVGVVPRVTVEIPAVPEDGERFRALLANLEEMGVKHINLHQLMLMGENGLALVERDYTFLRYPTPAVLESELSALETMRFALDEGVRLPINYCSLAFKYRWQNRGEDLRGGSQVIRPFETQCETGYVRRMWLDAEPELAAKLRSTAAVSEDLWDYQEGPGRLLFHPSLLGKLPTGERPVRVAYFKVVVGDREEAKSTAEIADYFEVELSSTKTIGIRLIQLCPPIELTAEQAKNLEENPPDTLACFENIALGLPDYA